MLAKYRHHLPRCNHLILSRPDILDQLEHGALSFDPGIPPNRVRQVSIDLLLGRRFTTFKEPPGYLTSIQMDPSLWVSEDLWEHEEVDSFLLKPGHFVLAQTLEQVYMPNTLMGLVEGRSSFARIGISVHVTAPKIDPGFKRPYNIRDGQFWKSNRTITCGKRHACPASTCSNHDSTIRSGSVRRRFNGCFPKTDRPYTKKASQLTCPPSSVLS